MDILKVLELHGKWLSGEEGGQRANLRDANLRGANLQADLRGANLQADLRDANLRDANLRDADLRGAILRGAILRGANLRDANLRDADLRDAILRGAILRDADLRDADLRGADLRGAILRGAKGAELAAARLMRCPAEGSFIAWKKCCWGVLVKLEIPSSARRSSASGYKCRASAAKVLEVIGDEVGDEVGYSLRDGHFAYRAGETVEPANGFGEDRWQECAGGIHFFMTREEAEAYG